jgi:hypothetical protein
VSAEIVKLPVDEVDQTANVVASKLLTIINAGLLALKSSLNITSADGTTQSTSSTGSLTISADTLDNSGNLSANEITLNVDTKCTQHALRSELLCIYCDTFLVRI